LKNTPTAKALRRPCEDLAKIDPDMGPRSRTSSQPQHVTDNIE
jgi:hypothetical protein